MNSETNSPVVEAVVATEVDTGDAEPEVAEANVTTEASEMTAAAAADVDEVSTTEGPTAQPVDEDELTVKSNASDDDGASQASSAKTPTKGSTGRTRRATAASKRSRPPSVAGLEIPFRTVKKAMKLDPDVPIVQTEAALMVTVAAELFVKSLAAESYKNAKARGKNVIQYSDVAEGRTKKPSLAFLQTLLP